MAILSFKDSATEAFFNDGILPRRCPWAQQANVAARKLDMLQAAATVEDLRMPPSNRLELLSGDMRGLYSIRINRQWRVIFSWPEEAPGPSDATIMDYH